MTIHITGTAGFIGSHTALGLMFQGQKTIGIDHLSDYYDVSLKEAWKSLKPHQAVDVVETSTDIDFSIQDLGFEPKIDVEAGIKEFIDWYKWYYKIDNLEVA